MELPERFKRQLREAGRLWLFLDYDGTLAEFAPTPDDVLPDPELIELIKKLAAHPRIHLAIISGRRLAHVEKLVPLPGILKAGTYGVELRLPSGETLERIPYQTIRPSLDSLKPQWAALLDERKGFYLEDKGWALAIHGRRAEADEADQVLAEGRRIAEGIIPDENFMLSDGFKFLEVGPRLADKGQTLRFLLDRFADPGALLVYLGDDDKDETAFKTIKEHGGLTVLVSAQERQTHADLRLKSPQETRRWLAELTHWLGE
jgi:trehalose 6-phosphate phosphatase